MKAGEILVRQRGTEWHAGENVKMGVDHTLYATEAGWVRFYSPLPQKSSPEEEAAIEQAAQALGRMTLGTAKTTAPKAAHALSPLPISSITPLLPASRPHPSSNRNSRRYVGISLTQDGELPTPRGEARPRRFSKVDLVRLLPKEFAAQSAADASAGASEAAATPATA